MHPLFVAAGPDIRPGAVIGIIHSVDVYSLLAHEVGIQPNLSDGSIAPFCAVLTRLPADCPVAAAQ